MERELRADITKKNFIFASHVLIWKLSPGKSKILTISPSRHRIVREIVSFRTIFLKCIFLMVSQQYNIFKICCHQYLRFFLRVYLTHSLIY